MIPCSDQAVTPMGVTRAGSNVSVSLVFSPRSLGARSFGDWCFWHRGLLFEITFAPFFSFLSG